MKSFFSLVAAITLAATPGFAQRGAEITLATTTSTQDTGLLDSLLPMFQRESGIRVKPIAVGTGAALELARRGDADAVLVHAPDAERAYVESGDLLDGRLVMHNDFLVLGPTSDPARAHGQKNAVAAMQAIGRAGAFISRGDGSGTEKKELQLWKAAGIAPGSMAKREETGQGMGATLLVAEERQSYVMTDRGTWLAFKDRLTLVPLVQGDPLLRNIYHVYTVNPGKHPTAHRAEALRFLRYITSPRVQQWIGRFGRAKYGEPLFYPDALESASAPAARITAP